MWKTGWSNSFESGQILANTGLLGNNLIPEEREQERKRERVRKRVTKKIIDNSKAQCLHSLGSVVLTIINYKTVVAE